MLDKNETCKLGCADSADVKWKQEVPNRTSSLLLNSTWIPWYTFKWEAYIIEILKEKKIPSFSPFPIFFHKTEILKIQLQLITNLDKKTLGFL